MRISFFIASLLISSILFAQNPQTVPDQAFGPVSQIFSQAGKPQPDGTQKYSWPRTDLTVSVNGVRIEPGLALGSWAAFKKIGETRLLTMGDLALLPSEVNQVISQLEGGGLEVLAIHNHLFGETPEVVYVHFMGRGNPEELATSLKNALTKTATPMQAVKSVTTLSDADQKNFESIQAVIGKKGNISGRILQINVPRKETITEDGDEIPSSMGMSITMNFQPAEGNRVASTGDFVLIAAEVNPVIKELQTHGIDVTALHTHMLRDSPHLFFMHYWALDSPAKVAGGLSAALSKIQIK